MHKTHIKYACLYPTFFLSMWHFINEDSNTEIHSIFVLIELNQRQSHQQNKMGIQLIQYL